MRPSSLISIQSTNPWFLVSSFNFFFKVASVRDLAMWLERNSRCFRSISKPLWRLLIDIDRLSEAFTCTFVRVPTSREVRYISWNPDQGNNCHPCGWERLQWMSGLGWLCATPAVSGYMAWHDTLGTRTISRPSSQAYFMAWHVLRFHLTAFFLFNCNKKKSKLINEQCEKSRYDK